MPNGGYIAYICCTRMLFILYLYLCCLVVPVARVSVYWVTALEMSLQHSLVPRLDLIQKCSISDKHKRNVWGFFYFFPN